MVPALDGLGGAGLGGNDGLTFWTKVKKSLFVAMVGFVLRDHHDIRFFDLGEVLDLRRNDMLGDGEPWR